MSRRPISALAFASVLAGAIACGGRATPATDTRPNILLVTIDTFRADRLGHGVTPNIDRLAASGVRFDGARTAVPLTLPSHTTIHTGLLPPQHGVRENGQHLDAAHPTIARLLQNAGYRTAAFVGAYVLDRRFGLADGFDVYDDRIPRDPNASERLEAERPAAAVIDAALAWLSTSAQARAPSAKAAGRDPFFVWIHLYDPHAPYTPPAEFAARAPTPYDGEIAYADAQLERFVDALRARGDLDRTVILVCGDHGEGLGDHHEATHGMLLYDSTLRVPLVIAAPPSSGVRPTIVPAASAVSLAEIAPTLLRAAGVAAPADMRGRDLVRLSRAFDQYSESEYPRTAGWSPLQALTDGRWKLIRAGGRSELYDVQRDPRESSDDAASQPNVVSAMAARADAIHASAAASARAISPDAEERLRALGYVASSATLAEPSTNLPNPETTIAAWNQFEDALSALNRKQPAAVSALERLAAAHPESPVFQATYARALKDTGEPLAALKVYREAARRSPTDAALMHDLAVAAREAAATASGSAAVSLRDEAARAEQAALALDPESAMAENGAGLIAIDAGRPADAARAFERATTRDPNNASYWTNLGNARRALGDRGGAEQAYQRALEVDARAADAANGLGVLLVEANRAGEAIAWFERALAIAPDAADARLNLGIALQQSGQGTRAADAYRRVLAAPGNPPEKQAAAKLLATLGAAR